MGTYLQDMAGFIRWAKRTEIRRGLICHFYISVGPLGFELRDTYVPGMNPNPSKRWFSNC
jgi:hypothetical protein